MALLPRALHRDRELQVFTSCQFGRDTHEATEQWIRHLTHAGSRSRSGRLLRMRNHSLVKPTTGQFTRFPTVLTGPPPGLTNKPVSLLTATSDRKSTRLNS